MRFSATKREHYKQFIRQQIENGRYATPNKVVLEALRELEEIAATSKEEEMALAKRQSLVA